MANRDVGEKLTEIVANNVVPSYPTNGAHTVTLPLVPWQVLILTSPAQHKHKQCHQHHTKISGQVSPQSLFNFDLI